MSEEAKKSTEQQAENDNVTPIKDPIELFSKGKLKLAVPIHADNKDYDELEYDFRALSGWEYAQCMDRDIGARNNAYNMTNEQAINLFAAAVTKMTKGLDATDVRTGLSIADAIKATQITVTFFVACTQEGNKRITSA